MEENRSMADQATQAEEMGNEAEAQGGATAVEPEKGKLFTQDEVNSFVQTRVSRMKSLAAKEAQAEYSQKLMELQAREMKLLVKERLSARGMPMELAEIITCADEKDLEDKMETLYNLYGQKAIEKEKPAGFTITGAAPASGNRRLPAGPDLIRNAMGLE